MKDGKCHAKGRRVSYAFVLCLPPWLRRTQRVFLYYCANWSKVRVKVCWKEWLKWLKKRKTGKRETLQNVRYFILTIASADFFFRQVIRRIPQTKSTRTNASQFSLSLSTVLMVHSVCLFVSLSLVHLFILSPCTLLCRPNTRTHKLKAKCVLIAHKSRIISSPLRFE